MTELPTPLAPETLARNRKHFGDEPHHFWVGFSTDEEPRLLNVNEVWQAARDGKRPTFFRCAPLMAAERQMLRYIATLEAGAQ